MSEKQQTTSEAAPTPAARPRLTDEEIASLIELWGPYADGDKYLHGMSVRNTVTALAELQQRRAADEHGYLVWSNEHKAWWRPNGEGYTNDVTRAGRFRFAEAARICKAATSLGYYNDRNPDELMTPSPEMRAALAQLETQK